MIRKVSGLLVLLALACIVGCGGMKSVNGIVTLDGKPLEGATVSFNPEDGKGEVASGMSNASGEFTLNTRGKPGINPGNYKVTVTKTKASTADLAPGGKPNKEEMIKMMKPKGPTAVGPMAMPSGPTSELPSK